MSGTGLFRIEREDACVRHGMISCGDETSSTDGRKAERTGRTTEGYVNEIQPSTQPR